MKKIVLALSSLTLFTLSSLMAQPNIGQTLTPIILDGNDGAYIDDTPFDSSILMGKTTMLMYVDPDEKSKGEAYKPTIEAFERDLDFEKFQILVILNLDATWKPNVLIKKLVSDKVDTYPKRSYILDKKSVLVKKWGLVDDEYNVLVINSKGKLAYIHSGEWEEKEISTINTLIRNEVK